MSLNRIWFLFSQRMLIPSFRSLSWLGIFWNIIRSICMVFLPLACGQMLWFRIRFRKQIIIVTEQRAQLPPSVSIVLSKLNSRIPSNVYALVFLAIDMQLRSTLGLNECTYFTHVMSNLFMKHIYAVRPGLDYCSHLLYILHFATQGKHGHEFFLGLSVTHNFNLWFSISVNPNQYSTRYTRIYNKYTR